MKPVEFWTEDQKRSFNAYLRQLDKEGQPFREWLEKRESLLPTNRGSYHTCPSCESIIPAAKNHIYCGACGQRLQREGAGK